MSKSEKFWDRSSKSYDKKEIEWDNINNKAIERTQEYLKPNHIVLDYGCGTGVLTALNAEYVKEIHALDISAGMLEVAKKHALERKLENMKYVQGTIFTDIYEEETFDVITGYNVIHLVNDPKADVRRVRELLKPEGLFISVTPCMGEKGWFVGSVISLLSKLKILPKVHKFKFSDVETLIQEIGFKLESVEDLQKEGTNIFIVARKQ